MLHGRPDLTLYLCQINLEIAYAHAFSTPSSIPVALRSLAFERAAVLFNLAALYSQLAIAEDRSSQDGLKRASTYYQVSFRAVSGRFNR